MLKRKRGGLKGSNRNLNTFGSGAVQVLRQKKNQLVAKKSGEFGECKSDGSDSGGTSDSSLENEFFIFKREIG